MSAREERNGRGRMGTVAVVLVLMLGALGIGMVITAQGQDDLLRRQTRLLNRIDQLERFIAKQGLEVPAAPGQSSGGRQSPTSPNGGQQPAGEDGPGPGQEDENDGTGPPPETGGGGGPPGDTPPPSPSPSPSDEPIIRVCPPQPLECVEGDTG